MNKRTKKSLIQIAEYMASGGAYFWSGYGIFFFIDKIIGASFFWAKSISTLLGWTVNFLLQRYWAFNNPSLKAHQTEVTKRYMLITLVDFVLDYLIVWGLTKISVFGFQINPYVGQFLSAGFFTVWNYLWYRFWVFPEKFKTRRSVHQNLPRVIAHKAHGHSAYRRFK